MWNVAEVIDRLRRRERIRFLFFWGHRGLGVFKNPELPC